MQPLFSRYTEGLNLNVEPLPQAGIKGQGVQLLVLNDGLQIGYPDLAANINRAMTWNFANDTADPTPSL